MDLLMSNSPINRFNNNEKLSNGLGKIQRLDELKKIIGSIKNCELKNSANKMFFKTGIINERIMK